MKPRVLVLNTGGTLGMTPRQPDLALAPGEFSAAILEHVPEAAQIAELEASVFCNIDSSDVTPDHWVALANEIAARIGDYDGVVVTHGTDAMAYTASALSFLLRDLPKPVVLTGSQRPLADARSDARANLVGAIDLATRPVPEVAIYFDGMLLRGNRTTKRSSFAYAAYTSPNFPPLAEVGTGVRLNVPARRPETVARVEGAFDRRVVAVRLLPGQPAAPLAAMAGAGVRAVLLQAFGVGNLPVVDRGVADAIRALDEAGVVVAVGSQSSHGGVDLSLYAGGRLAAEAGAVGAGDMTTEAAAVKLMYLLGSERDPRRVKARLLVPLAGEVSA
ncbi:asparaginase [bacterium]|nr:asparaginase [bacterium]